MMVCIGIVVVIDLLRLDCTQTSWDDRFDTTYIDMIIIMVIKNDDGTYRRMKVCKRYRMFENHPKILLPPLGIQDGVLKRPNIPNLSWTLDSL